MTNEFIKILKDKYKIEIVPYVNTRHNNIDILKELSPRLITPNNKVLTIKIKENNIDNIFFNETALSLLENKYRSELPKIINTISILSRQNILYKMLGFSEFQYLYYKDVSNELNLVLFGISNNGTNMPKEIRIPDVVNTFIISDTTLSDDVEQVILPDNIIIDIVAESVTKIRTKIINIDNSKQIWGLVYMDYINTDKVIKFRKLRQLNLKASVFKHAEKIEFLKDCCINEVDLSEVTDTKEIILNDNLKRIKLSDKTKLTIYTPLDKITIADCDYNTHKFGLFNIPTMYGNNKIVRI